MEQEWDDYEPQTSAEFEQCGLCRSCRNHTVADHKREIRRAQTAELHRQQALHRHARVVYDSDRF